MAPERDRQAKTADPSLWDISPLLSSSTAADERVRRLLEGAARANLRVGHDEPCLEVLLDGTGVSRATFYEYFDDVEDCVLTAQLDAFSRFRTVIEDASPRRGPWLTLHRARVGAALEHAAAEPAQVSLLLIPSFVGKLGSARETLLAYLCGLLSSARAEFGVEPPELTELVYVGGAVNLVESHLSAGTHARLPALRDEIAQLLAMPFMGVSPITTSAGPSAGPTER